MLARTMPEMAITQPEAESLAKAFAGWRKYYGGVIDPKTQALMTLLGTAAIIEGPRILQVLARTASARKQTQAEKATVAQPRVVPMAAGGWAP